jgi:CheY-like chemotaxis protein
MARILIIEDADDERASLRESLICAGHRVCCALNGKAALPLLREWHVDIVITDMLMPEMDGVETIINLRRDYPDLKIIAVSGLRGANPDVYLRLARNLGAHVVMAKPFTTNEILEVIDALSQGGSSGSSESGDHGGKDTRGKDE